MMKLDLTTILVAILAILILCIAFMKKSAPASEGFRRRRFAAVADPKKKKLLTAVPARRVDVDQAGAFLG
jgi:hypothetical protein